MRDRRAGGAEAARSARALTLIGVGCGLVTVLTTFLPNAPGLDVATVRWVGVVTSVIALALPVVPWRRLPSRATLALVPVALTLIGWHNYSGGADPFRYGVYYLVLFVWVGIFHPRGTALAFAPLAAVSYLLPLLLHHAPAYELATVGYSVPLYVGVAEVLAWRSAALARTQARLRHLAEHDPLTGLANRALFLRELEHAVPDGGVGVVYIDLDDFKLVNDRYGHAAGDEVLRRAAEAICAGVREQDLVARLAGDEFAVLLRDLPAGGDTVARGVAERVLAQLRGVDLTGLNAHPPVEPPVGADALAAALIDPALIDPALIDGAVVDPPLVNGARVDSTRVDGTLVDGIVIESVLVDSGVIDSGVIDSGVIGSGVIDSGVVASAVVESVPPRQGRLDASVGLAVAASRTTADELVARADTAMYAAKRATKLDGDAGLSLAG